MSKDFLKNAAQALNTERCKLILFPTEKCNFRCLYCYEDHVGEKMSSDTISSIKKFLVKKNTIIKTIRIRMVWWRTIVSKRYCY